MSSPDTQTTRDDGTVETVRTRDGRALRLERWGSGAPTVVFEAGMGFSHHSSGAVIPLVAERASVAAYDRSGLGQSEPDPAPRTLDRLAADLGEVLDHLGDGPFVLVGHSWGGPIIRKAAASSPDRIAGLVLVDQSDERCDAMRAAGAEWQAKITGPLLPLAARLGLLRMAVKPFAAKVPEPWATGLREEDGTVTAAREQQAELKSSTDDLRALHAHPLTLPDVPVTVISGTVNGRGEKKRRPALIEAHRASAAAAPQGRHVAATRSSHYVPITEPDLIADEILRIVDSSNDG